MLNFWSSKFSIKDWMLQHNIHHTNGKYSNQKKKPEWKISNRKKTTFNPPHTVDLQTGEVNEANIVVKCFNRFPIPKLDLKVWDRKSVKAFHNNVYLSCLASLQVYSLCLSHTVKLHSTPSPKEWPPHYLNRLGHNWKKLYTNLLTLAIIWMLLYWLLFLKLMKKIKNIVTTSKKLILSNFRQ